MKESHGIALLCDEHGKILEVARDSLGVKKSLQPGVPFTRLVAQGSLAKALSFITEIKAQGAAFDWEINILVDDQVLNLHFTGGKVQDALLIVGAENGRFSLKLYEEMMRMSNEQTNALRSALKQQSQKERDDYQYNDISRLNNELVAMQRELAKQNSELARLNQEKNHFLGMAAHDLRNPLHAILSHSEFLLDECADLEQREFLEVIHDSSKFMAQVIDDLLDVAKIEAGQLELDYSTVDICELVRKNIALNRVLAAKKKIHIELTTDDMPTVAVDSAKLHQVLNNLISNAIKFSAPGSQILVHLDHAGDQFILSVQDHGPGISEEEMTHLFKPFQRGRRGLNGEKSTGLGLVIVKRIVEGHGGKLWLESQIGVGTTFFVSIPIMPDWGTMRNDRL